MHLNCHSVFSFTYGVLPPKQLLMEGQKRGLEIMVLTDINNTSGCIDFARLAPKYGITPIVGIDFRKEGKQLYIGIARNNKGFKELNDFLTDHLLADTPIPDTPPDFDNVFIIYPWEQHRALSLRDHEYIGLKPRDIRQFEFIGNEQLRYKMVVLATATFRGKADFNTHRLLRAIGENALLSKLPKNLQGDITDILLSKEQLQKLYNSLPELIKNTEGLIQQCSIDFEFGVNKNKLLFNDTVIEDRKQLMSLAEKGLAYRYSDPSEAVKIRLYNELETINNLGFAAYFLVCWDLCQYARHKGFYHVGRGSGANSLVAYCLGISDVDPIELNLFFERFMNASRKNPPDFDIDFSWRDRDEMIAYLISRYPHKHVAMIATYNTFQQRAAVRELGKVFGLPAEDIEKLEAGKLNKNQLDDYGRIIYRYAPRLVNLPRHLSVHAGGVLISEEELTHYSALEMPPKGFPITQYSMLEAEDIGLYKYDILSQRGLGHIRDSVEIIKENRGIEVDIHDIPRFKTDTQINDKLSKGTTIGCFYIESPAMRQLLRKLEVDNYEDLVAASSVIRPGVSSSGMMAEFIKRTRYSEERKKAHPILMRLMPETHGVMVYQEDVMKVAHHYGGLTLEESDVMRRGMSGKFRSREEFLRVKDTFFENCQNKGHTEADYKEVWRQIESFAGYSFAKGHSASYAVESYQSLFLKTYYPIEFMVGVLNNFGGFYGSEYYFHEAKMCGATVELPCVNNSSDLNTLQGTTIYMGFVHVKDLQKRTIEELLKARKEGAFKDLYDFVKRVPIALLQLRILIRLKAFRFTGKSKKELLWEAHLLLSEESKSAPKPELFDERPKDFVLPELESIPYEDILDELEILGFPYNSPFKCLKNPVIGGITANEMLSYANKRVYITGYFVTLKPVRTVRNQTMNFGCFIDREGTFFDTVHFPPSLARFPFTGKGCYTLEGKVTVDFGVPTLEVRKMGRLAWAFDQLEERFKSAKPIAQDQGKPTSFGVAV